MKSVIFSTKAKKDLKRYKHDILLLKALQVVLQKLAKEEKLPKSFRPHFLLGQYTGCMECHIGNDFLLVWIDEEAIKVVRIGTHSELFG